MKIIPSLIAFLLLAGTVSVLPDAADAVVCQNKTVIVYGNGIYNTRRMANESKLALEDELSAHLQGSQLLADIIRPFDLAYADNGGATNPFSISGIEQLLEFFNQARADSTSDFWFWLSGIIPAPQWFQDAVTSLATSMNSRAYVGDVDLAMHVTRYTEYLNNGNRVVIVSHSQGNFYANAAYDQLVATNPSWADSIDIVSVATPASRVAGRGFFETGHVTAVEDLVIDAVIVLGIFLDDIGIPLLPNSSNLLDGTSTDWKGHDFVGHYLNGNSTHPDILNLIVTTIGGLPSTTTISVTDSSVTEGSGGGVTNLNFSVTMCSASTSGVTVNYATSDGTANSGSDYTAANGTLTIPVGSTIGTIAVAVTGDTVFELNETLMLTLSNPVNATLGTAMATGTILDDDRSSPYYYRDDWGALGSRKHLRDDLKGLAFSISVVTNQDPISGDFNTDLSIKIVDYVSNEIEQLQYTLPSPPTTGQRSYSAPRDILLWSEGIVLLYEQNRYYASSHIGWSRLSLSDAGTGSVPRWSVSSVNNGELSLPTYPVTQPEWTYPYNAGPYTYVQQQVQQWRLNYLVPYRTGPYTYRVPIYSGATTWVDYPGGVQESSQPYSQLYNFGGTLRGYYGAVDIIDGALQHRPLGEITFQLGPYNVLQTPSPILDFGLDSSMAYRRMQAAAPLQNSGAIEPGWNSQSGAFIVTPLVNGGKLFSHIDAASLSDKMALKGFSGSPDYKLGIDFVVAADDPVLQQLTPPVWLPTISYTRNPIYMTPEQKAFLEDPNPPAP